MAAPPNVELEAAKFLQKLIQESKDEPTKLATKLHVILKHMRSSGKENSMPYQVISRAMETVINQHGLDINALMSSHIPSTTGTQVVDSASSQYGGSSLRGAVAMEANTSLVSNDITKSDSYASNRPPVGPSFAGHDIYQGSASQLNSKTLDHESPSSFDTRSAKSHSEESRDPPKWEKAGKKKDNKKAASKRKRADPSSNSESQYGNIQPLESSTFNSGMDKAATMIDQPRSISIQGGEHAQFHNMVQSSSTMDHNAMRSTLRAKQDIQYPRFSFHTGGDSSGETLLHQSSGTAGEVNGMSTGTSVPYAAAPGFPGPMQFSDTYNNPSLRPKMHKDSNLEQLSSASAIDLPSYKGAFGKALEHEGGTLHASGNDNSIVQSGMLINVTEMALLRNTGKLPVSQSSSASIMPFKEQHLKQLRAQCLVYLAFRNGLKPKKLHLDFALGNFISKDEGLSKEMIDQKVKEQLIDGTSNTLNVPMSSGRLENSRESESFSVDPSSEYMTSVGEKNAMPTGATEYGEESRQIMMTRRKPESEMHTREIAQSQISAKGAQTDGFILRGSPRNNHKDDIDIRHQQLRSMDQASSVMTMSIGQMQTEATGQTGNSCNEEASKFSLQSSTIHNECGPERIYTAPSQSFSLADRNFQGSRPADAYLPSFPSSAHWKPLSRVEGGNHMVSPDDLKISYKSFSSSDGSKRVPVDNALDNVNSSAVEEHVPEEEDSFITTDLPPSSKYTTTEKWIIDQQKRKLLQDKTWELKQQRTLQRITACSDKLKDNVSSSEDISAKTRSVIELKKLQLLELQSRLRNDILNDFFRPIASDMDRLKSIKKHRIGRRSKQLEKYEQKMKEERQKRFRERQKEFFSEIEIHKERLEDVFKIRRERCKGFNRSVREFHKRKERVHREKIDRIQREKINLLKINDVEGYLRMVQDAKSDRVKQLLKETEKYLQKLGSKLRDAKVISRCFETSMDDTQSAVFMDKNEMTIDNEDETDQAKHYLESNEKYYLMAHSIKENVAEQPTGLVGGKLREYQMNGLRWLVSLYNNHLNGILADEMGLGKTVQVISLFCYLMENKNDRGPFLVVVPSSVLPGWNSEIDFWAPSINKIVYSGPPEERRRLFKERIVPQKFNVLLTTYEYLMNKHDRPKLSKIHWHYVIIDEGHRIKNASCKLNADLKLYHSSHRLLLTGTPLQNNLEELWALLNFLLPNIFNSSEDFSQWFNKPFESNGDSSPDEALLSEEENLLIINRLHQVLRPFVLRRLKHKVENELPEKIERLVRCEASGYQKLLMKRVEDNLGAFGTSKARSVHNSVMELRNICNHPYLSQLHSEEVHDYIPKHYLPNIVRLCGKLEMLDRILPKLKATDHRVLLFSTMTRLLDVMEDYLYWKQYKYLRLDGHTSGGDRGALIDQYNKPDSPYFIFLLSIRAGGVGVNLQAADTVIIFDTDWNPQVDLQAQARAHRIGQKREVLVLRFETVQTVEEQVRAAAEHKLGVANQSITAGFFDNNTSAEDRREYLESLLRECKKEEAAPVLHDDAVNDLIARSESEIDIFESIDKRRQEEEMAAWKLTLGERTNSSEPVLTLPSRLVTAEDLKSFSEAMKIYDAPTPMDGSNVGIKRKSGYLGGLDTQHYGRGKRAREVRSYEEQWTEDEFEKLCQTESPHSPKMKTEVNEMNIPVIKSENSNVDVKAEMMVPSEQPTQQPFAQSVQPSLVQLVQPLLMKTTDAPGVHSTQLVVGQSTNLIQQELQSPVVQAGHTPVSQAGHPPNMQSAQQSKEITPKRGRGRPKRATTHISPSKMVGPALSGAGIMNAGSQTGTVSNPTVEPGLNSVSTTENSIGTVHQSGALNTPSSQPSATLPSASPNSQPTTVSCPVPIPDKRRGNKGQSGGETTRRRGRKSNVVTSNTQVPSPSPRTDNSSIVSPGEIVSTLPSVSVPATVSVVPPVKDVDNKTILSLSSGNIKPQNAPVSSSPILSIPTVAVGVGVATNELHKGTTDSEQKLPFCPLPHDSQSTSVGTGTSSVPNPQFSAAPQSVSSSQVVPKQVKGRGRKAQTEGETPGRRGRRPKGASTELPGGSGGKELTSTEPPQEKSRVSSGRTTIASRRKQQNETQNLVNVSQANASNVQTSDSVVGLDLSNLNDRHNQCIKNENNQSTSSAVAVEVASPLKEFANVKMIQPDVTVSGDRILLTEMEVASPSKESANVKVIQADVPVSEDDITFSREKAANVKVIQPDAPVSGDGVLLTDTEVSQSRVDPGRIEIRNSEVNGDTQSLEFQSAISEILPLNHSASSAIGSVLSSEIGTCDAQTNVKGSERVDETTTASQGTLLTQNSPTNDSESKRKAADDVSCAEELADIKILDDCGISGAARTDTLTDICEDQNLEDTKSLPNMETSMDTQIYGNTSNLAMPILETGQVSDVVNVGSLLEEKSGEKLEEVTNAFPDGSVPPVSEVHKFSSPRISDVCIQNVADINITQKSFRGEGAIQYVSEKPLDSEDCVVNITGNMVSYNEGKLVDEGNAMVESRENADSFEVSTALDGTKQDLVGSSGPDDMSETVEGAITVVAGDEDGSAGLVGVDITLAKDVSPSSFLECASEKPDMTMTVDAVVAPEYDTGENAASVKSEPEGHYEATEFSKPKVLHEEDEKEAHRTTKVGSDPLSGDAIEGKESKSSENVIGIFDEVNTKEISRQHISGITQFCDPAFEIRQPSEDAPVRQCSTQTAEEVLYRPTESINETKETENVISDGQTCTEAKFVENMEIIVETVQYERLEQQGSQILHDTGETVDVLEQNQTHTEVSQDEKMQVLKATEPNWSEHKEVGLVCVVEQKVVETGHTEELLDLSRRDTSAEVQNFQEATSHDRREHEDRLPILPLEVSENVDVLHLGPKTTAEVGPRLEVFTKEQCQIQAEEDSNSSETSKVPGETSNNKTEQVETIVTNNVEVMVEVEQSLEAVASLQCQTQMDRDGEVSNKVKFSCEQRQSQTKEDSEPSESTKNVPGETICVIMDRGDEVMHDNEEVTIEVGQRLETLSAQQCQAQMEKDLEASEKVELFSEQHEMQAEGDSNPAERYKDVPGESTCGIEEQGNETMHDNMEVSIGVGQILEEPYMQQCRTVMKDDCEDFEKVDPLQEAAKNEASDKHEDEVLHFVVDTEAEICRTTEELSGKQSKTKGRQGGEVSPSILEEIAHDASLLKEDWELETGLQISQRLVRESEDSEACDKAEITCEATEHGRREEVAAGGVLHATQETAESICQKMEAEQCQLQGSGDSEPSKKVELLPEAIEHEIREEVAGRSLHITEDATASIGQLEEFVRQSQTPVNKEVKPSEVVEAFKDQTGHDENQQGCNVSSHTLGENSAELVHTECQIEEKVAVRLDDGEDGMDLQTSLVIDSGGENVLEIGTKNVSEPDQICEEKCASTGCTKDTDKDELEIDVQSSIGAGEQREDPPTEHAAE